MQNKGLLIGLGALAAVAIGAFFLLGGASRSQPGQPEVTAPSPAPESTEPSPPAGGEEVREITVEGDEYSLSPSSLSFRAGETVKLTFRNTGNLSHNFTITELGVATKTIAGGQEDTITFTVEESGEFSSFCSVGNHRALGMEGEVMVE